MEDTFTDIQPVNKYLEWAFCGLLFSHSVVSDFFWPHGLQHTRLPYPSPSPGACSNSCPSSWWCHPTISSSYDSLLPLPSIFPSIRVFSNESALWIRWPKYWCFSSSISPFNEYSGLISFRFDWFHLAVQGTLNSLLQLMPQLKASILWRSGFSLSSSHICTWLPENHRFDETDLCRQSNVSSF